MYVCVYVCMCQRVSYVLSTTDRNFLILRSSCFIISQIHLESSGNQMAVNMDMNVDEIVSTPAASIDKRNVNDNMGRDVNWFSMRWFLVYCYNNFHIIVIGLVPYYFGVLCDPAQYLFTDSEYYGTHVSYKAKLGVFFVVLLIMLYYFRSSFIIKHQPHLRVIWLILYSVIMSFILHAFLAYNGVFRLLCLVVANLLMVLFQWYFFVKYYREPSQVIMRRK